MCGKNERRIGKSEGTGFKCFVIIYKEIYFRQVKNKFFAGFWLIAINAAIFISSCRQINVFEKNTPIPNYEWSSKFAAAGTFDISDTAAAYDLSIVLRHTDAYNYNNIWLNVGLQAPGDSMYFQKLDLSLGNDAKGWEGTGMNDIWEVRKLLNGKPRRFKKMGEYKFQIFQIMRDEPLKNVLSAGLRVEKASQ
jgi:gliding motility-associated lipoprotein GldH